MLPLTVPASAQPAHQIKAICTDFICDYSDCCNLYPHSVIMYTKFMCARELGPANTTSASASVARLVNICRRVFQSMKEQMRGCWKHLCTGGDRYGLWAPSGEPWGCSSRLRGQYGHVFGAVAALIMAFWGAWGVFCDCRVKHLIIIYECYSSV